MRLAKEDSDGTGVVDSICNTMVNISILSCAQDSHPLASALVNNLSVQRDADSGSMDVLREAVKM